MAHWRPRVAVTEVLARAGAARRQESEFGLARLHDEVAEWLAHRRNADARSQYASQLRAIESFIEGALDGLQASLLGVDAGGPLVEVYSQCRAFDQRAAWLRRVWQFFREKFDQRDDPELGAVLAAADEVVWSCYRQVVDRATLAGLALDGPPPLPYIESYLSPEAFPAELVPAGLKTEVDLEFAREHLNRLPIPVVRLQTTCVSAPWWLVYIGHEVGHHVQYGLLAEMGLVGGFRTAVETAVSQAGGSPEDTERWGRWSREVFADVCSVLFMGPWAVWAIAELELGRPEVMVRRRGTYPSPAVRLLLLTRVADRLGLDAQPGLRGLDLDALLAGDPAAAADAGFVAAVVDTALAPPAQLPRTLAQLTGFGPAPFGPEGAVAQWRDILRAAGEPLAERSLVMPRVLTCASLAAWADVAPAPENREAFADRVVELIRHSGPEGTRAAAAEGPDSRALGRELAGLLERWEPAEV